MPIFRVNDQLHYFAHVPKCGGSSIETYLTERFGPLAFDEPDRHLVPENLVWNYNASQHIPVFALNRLIPDGWLASSFAVVRNPVGRLVSAFFYARDVRNLMPLSTEINAWFQDVVPRIIAEPFRHGGHFLPQSALVPKDSRIFRFEEGFDKIPAYLDALAGNSDGPREILTRNVGKWRNIEQPPELTDATLALVAQVYAEDFARFGYDIPSSPGSTKALTDLPALSVSGRPPQAKHRPLAQRLKHNLMKRAGL